MKKIVFVGIFLVIVACVAVAYYATKVRKPTPPIPAPVVKEKVEKVEELIIKDLIFTFNKDEPPRIYTTDLDGKNQIKLSDDPDSVWDGLVSASGRRIAM